MRNVTKQTILAALAALMMTLPQLAGAQTRPASPAKPAAKQFILANGKLGPIKTGMSDKMFPKRVEGLYDKFVHEEEDFDSEDGETITVEDYLFTKAGKPVFKATLGVDTDEVVSFTLLEGSSSIVKTPKGVHVGYSARELFKKNLRWYSYNSAVYVSDDDNYTYTVPMEGLVQGKDVPEKITDLKPDAKVTEISY